MGGRTGGRGTTHVRRTRRQVGAALAGLLLVGTGTACGGSGTSPDAAPAASRTTPAATAGDKVCRTKWSLLGQRVRREATKGASVRKAFADRWNSIEAGIDYYRQTATSQQCGDLLRDRRTTIRQTAAVVADALPYDATQRRRTALALRSMYRALPGGTKEPKPVAAAYTALTEQTPTAEKDLAPAYAELAAADPADAKAVKRATADLTLLSETSDAWAAVTAALGTIGDWNTSLRKNPAPRTP